MPIKKEPLVSIIMPAHNAAAFIADAIKSVLKQRYHNWELIIIDDCSTDRTYELASRYQESDPRIKLISNQEKMGVASTRNKGIQMALGDYISFLDSDDVWSVDKLSEQISFMDENNVAISFTDYVVFETDVKLPIRFIKCPDFATSTSILKSNCMGCLTVTVNKVKTGPFLMPNLDHGEDMLTWYDIMKRGYSAQCIHKPLAYYRVSHNSLSSNKRSAAKKQWKIYRNYLHFPLLKSCFYFFSYAVRGLLKRIN